ncbi:hypothetical protein MTO96_043612 [Rhipicephalus appendiculatus]
MQILADEDRLGVSVGRNYRNKVPKRGAQLSNVRGGITSGRYKVIQTSDKGVQTVLDARERGVCSGGRWRCGNGFEAMCPRVARHSISHFSKRVCWDSSCSHEDQDDAMR